MRTAHTYSAYRGDPWSILDIGMCIHVPSLSSSYHLLRFIFILRRALVVLPLSFLHWLEDFSGIGAAGRVFHNDRPARRKGE